MTTDENELPDEALDEEDLPGYFTERLPVPLSAELFDQTVVALTTTLRARGTTKDAASAAAKATRATLERLDAKIDTLITTIETNKAHVDVRCRRVAHADRPFWQLIRTDTGEVFHEESMSADEVVEQRQGVLPLNVSPTAAATPVPGATPLPLASPASPSPVGPPQPVLRSLFPREHQRSEPDAIIEVAGTASGSGVVYTTLRCRGCGGLAEIKQARYDKAVAAYLAESDQETGAVVP